MARCDTCKANKICDHDKYGFENCNNYIPVDVVEVVRCKDCKRCFINSFGKESSVGICNKRGVIGTVVQLDDFCSYGERRETNAKML